MKKYGVEVVKTYTVFVAADSELEAVDIVDKMNEEEVKKACTYYSDLKIQRVIEL